MVLSDNGTVKLNLGNGSTVINGDLSITGTTVVSVRAPLTAHTLTLGGTTQGAAPGAGRSPRHQYQYHLLYSGHG